ncbi:type II toxin-antitoxin system VapC family toxin [Glaciimonas soli]|uniref:PIN domain-containing protein n=1 Tax=Glaciimonas soli TaxID=2590999 RepID=A0A843YK96_9BURK|nr:type II toxin-antitoxin system VapC family toxin [Glaciimonas soli]MQR00229.1 PIN domain-containing protein [Glaciimonas soli]
MIVFDANILITLATENESSELYERLLGLIQDLVKSKTTIGIPAPSWAEVLCGTDIATNGIISMMKKRSAIRILPFDEVSALEAALIHRGAMNSGSKKGASKKQWQQIKVDRQILAIARQHQVKVLYTGDENMIAEAARLGIEAIRPSEIPLKIKQISIDFDKEENASVQPATAATLPTATTEQVPKTTEQPVQLPTPPASE